MEKKKILTNEQSEMLITFVYIELKNGNNNIKYENEHLIILENDIYIMRLQRSLFELHNLSYISFKNKKTNEILELFISNMVSENNISDKLFYINNVLNSIVEKNKPVYYKDNEVQEIIGVSFNRNEKMKHIVSNIKENKKKRFFLF